MKQAGEMVKEDPAFLSEQDGSKRTLMLMGRARELFDALKAVPSQDPVANLPNDMTQPPPPVVAAPQAQPSAGNVTPLSSSQGLPVVNTPEEAAKLPSGTRFKTPDGRIKIVP
jgi:hypothetical protein